jgi:hypothetical protein
MTTSASALLVVELAVARLCHDFSGLIGTLDGALESLGEAGAAAEDDEALRLAREAAAELGLRLRLWRGAWTGMNEAMTIPDLFALLRALPAARRVRLTAAGMPEDVAFALEDARVILNVLILAVESAGGGGGVLLAGQPDGDLAVILEGKTAAWPAGLAVWLADDAAAIAACDQPRTIQGPLTALVARASGATLSPLLATGPGGGPAPLLIRLAGA